MNVMFKYRLPCSWNFSGKNIGVYCHFLFQGIFLTQGLNSHLFNLLHYQMDSLPCNLVVQITWDSVALGYTHGLHYIIFYDLPIYYLQVFINNIIFTSLLLFPPKFQSGNIYKVFFPI